MSAGVIADSYVAADVQPGPSSSIATLTIPAGKVSATLTDFVTRVDLAALPAGFWAAVRADGGNLRVRQGGVDVPVDVVAVSPSLRLGELFFKATLTTADNVFTIEALAGATMPAVTDPIGRNAVWSGYDDVYVFESTVSRTGSGRDLTLTYSATQSEFEFTGPINGATAVASHQGVVWDGTHFYVIDTDEIVKYTSAWAEVARNATPLASSGVSGIAHLGNGFVYAGELYVPAEADPFGATFPNQHVLVFSTATLGFVRQYDISANGHETSGITRHPGTGHWFITSYGASGGIHEYAADFSYVGPLPLSGTLPYPQDVEYLDGLLYVTTGGGTSGSGDGIYESVWRVKPDGSQLARVMTVEKAGFLEGLSADGVGGFYVSWYQTDGIFRLLRQPSKVFSSDARGYASAPNPPTRTTWTMGVSARTTRLSVSSGMVSYSKTGDPATVANPSRESLAMRGTNNIVGLWNSTDSWVQPTGAMVANTRYRFNATHATTANRRVYRNGALAVTDTTVAQRPLTPDRFYVGASFDVSPATASNEHWAGTLQYAYLRNGELPASWLAAEYASWETPASFYTIT